MKKLFRFILVLSLSGLVFSCKKKKDEPDPDEPSTGVMKVSFNHMVGSQPLEFQKIYLNPAGDTFTVKKFIYYISNIVLTKSDNSVYAETESYRLVDHSQSGTNVFSISNVPSGNYKSISFLLGVDSTRNCSGVQKGALDQAKGMFWSWSSGYIFFKLEGNAPQSGGNGSLIYHVGGYAGPNKTQRNFNLDFAGSEANVSASHTPVVNIKMDINEFFKSPTTIDFKTQYYQMTPGPAAKVYADNYADIMSFQKIDH